MAGEGRRLGDSSHNGLSSAYPAGRVHLVGDGGSLLNPSHGPHHETVEAGSLQKSIETPTTLRNSHDNEELPTYSTVYDLGTGQTTSFPLDLVSPATPVTDEGVEMNYDDQWGMVQEQGWSFNHLNNQQPPNSDADDMFGADRNSVGSNDSTRVEGNAGSVNSDEGYQDTPMFSDANVQDDAHVRSMRESAPAPDYVPVTQEADDDEDLPVVEIPPP